ncbi:MAG: GIY-YIG nuclease family protein, partial [Candidatus Omnitrophica bacterium]|nr:GIY-YIG nuclease family protein [Candidatus Omnitrophota bacterium]
EEDLKNKTNGCYILINKSRGSLKVYCGQSKRIKDRLSKHERAFKLFNSIELEKEELDKYECLIFHLIRSSCRTNDSHPPLPKHTKKCPYCD